MFEESTLFKISTNHYARPSLSSRLKLFKTVTLTNQKHHCPIYLWIAKGVIKRVQSTNDAYILESKWFLYIEYKDNSGNNRYLQRQFNTLEAALTFAEHDAPTLRLAELN